MTTERLAIIGDVGGHLAAVTDQLTALGVDVGERQIPHDLIVCQVGDLIHKGPDSAAVVTLVDQIMEANPGRWVQLLGNHEAQYLPGGTQFWAPEVPDETADILRRWWNTGRMRVAAAFDVTDNVREPATASEVGVDSCPPGPLLITHAGLTVGAWRLLGHPETVTEIVDVLNEASAPVVWREGGIITGVEDVSAGPLWALSASEVYTSWAAFHERQPSTSAPTFAQAHGHTAARSWRFNHWSPPLEAFEKRTDVTMLADERRRITRVQIRDRVFFGTDPGSGKAPANVSLPLIFELS